MRRPAAALVQQVMGPSMNQTVNPAVLKAQGQALDRAEQPGRIATPARREMSNHKERAIRLEPPTNSAGKVIHDRFAPHH